MRPTAPLLVGLAIVLLVDASAAAEPACPRRPRPEITLSLSAAAGGLWADPVGWLRADVSLRLGLGIRLHPGIQLDLLGDVSVERLRAQAAAGVSYFPWRRGAYGRLALDVLFSGVGVQPGLSLAVGYVWNAHRVLGLFAEAQAGGRVTAPYSADLVARGGVLVRF